jgi:hypothetical protein
MAAALPVPELEALLVIYRREPELWAEDLEAFLGAVHRYAEAPAFYRKVISIISSGNGRSRYGKKYSAERNRLRGWYSMNQYPCRKDAAGASRFYPSSCYRVHTRGLS